MKDNVRDNLPKIIFNEYQSGIEFKNRITDRGLYEQSKMNERFYVGDQWHGANCGNDRPLVRHNIIKRIGDYKISMISSSPISVNYSAEGVPNTVGIKDSASKVIEDMENTIDKGIPIDEAVLYKGPASNEEIAVVMRALSDYFRVTAERLKFDTKKEQALRNAYISGTGVMYTYWNPNVSTGLYADESHTAPIKGDIESEVIDIENVYFGDPNEDDVQKQPYIIIAQRKPIKELRDEAKKYGANDYEISQIKSDEYRLYEAGDYGNEDLDLSKKAVVLTKFWRENIDGETKIKAVRVCETVVIRPEWDLDIRLYPISKFTWERRRNNTYGESEITYLIPNQIAINRMLTANVWAVLMLGMPIMVVDNSVIVNPVTNEPGQIYYATGDADQVRGAIQYINPPSFSPNFENNIASLIANTLTQSGANDAALGDVNPDNTSAIIAVREAATMPLQAVQNRYYQFCEDIARIWAEFWITKYGKRSIKMEDGQNIWYMPFDGNRYKNLLISARIDVGSSTLYGEAQTIRTLDGLFDRQVIDLLQYLKRLPKGVIPDVSGLIKEIEETNKQIQQAQALQMAQADMAQQNIAIDDVLAGLSPEEMQVFSSLPQEEQQIMIQNAMGGAYSDGNGVI